MEGDTPPHPSPSHTHLPPHPSAPSPVDAVPNPSDLPTPLEAFARPPKRSLGGKFAHVVENTKVAREDEMISYPPSHRLTDDYERSFQDPRTRFPRSTRLLSSGRPYNFTGLQNVPPYPTFQSQVAFQQELVRRRNEHPAMREPSYPPPADLAHNAATSRNPTDHAPDPVSEDNPMDVAVSQEAGPSGTTERGTTPKTERGTTPTTERGTTPTQSSMIMSQQSVGRQVIRTVSWISPATQARVPLPDADVLHLLKLLRKEYHQEAELMSDAEAEETWMRISNEERYHVLQIYSRRSAQVQIAASEAAFMSIPTNHIVAQQNAASSVSQPEDPQQGPRGLLISSGHESSANPTVQRVAGSSRERPLQSLKAPPPPAPSQTDLAALEMNHHMDCDAPNLDSRSQGVSLPSPSPHDTPKAPQFNHVQPFDNMQDMWDEPPLPFTGSQFDLGAEHFPAASQNKGKQKAVNHVHDTSETQDVDPPELPEPPSPHPRPEVPVGAATRTQEATAPGDQSGHLTGGVIAMIVSELRAVNGHLRENTELQRQTIQALMGVPLNQTQSTDANQPEALPTSSRTSQTIERRTRTPVRSVRDQKLANTSLRARKRKQRVLEKVARWQGKHVDDLDATQVDEAMAEDRDLTRLKARVRNLLQSMLGIDDWKESAVLHPALTPEQVKSFNEGKLTCTAHEFFVDFDHPWKLFKPNRVAREIFLDHFFARVEGGAYLKKPTPPHLLTREVVGSVLDKHMPYCRLRWRRSLKPLTEDRVNAIKARAAKNSRKRSIHLARSVIVRRHGNLRHVQLWLLLEPGNMDGDEPVGGEEKTFPVKFHILRPKWASQELCNYWWSLDAEYRLHYGKPTHERATRGNPPRDRELPKDSVEDGIAPVGLWRNCYDKAWLDSLEPCLLRELEIVEEDFDFNLEPPPEQNATDA